MSTTGHAQSDRARRLSFVVAQLQQYFLDRKKKRPARRVGLKGEEAGTWAGVEPE